MLSQSGRPAKAHSGVGARGRRTRGPVDICIARNESTQQPHKGPAVLRAPHRHIRHHGRFYLALAIGAAAFMLTAAAATPLRLAAAGDAFYGAYLAATLSLAARGTPSLLRRRATYEDEGMILIVIITLAAIALSLTAMFSVMNTPGPPDMMTLALTILSVPLGWLTLHTIAAFHYGHLYYTRTGHDGGGRDAAGLRFPDTEEPTSWDFLYYSFVIGMTAQVSDVQVLTTSMRRLAVIHGIVSFFYNTVLLALAVNIVVSLTR
jgi:uncharacterized membrane protein